MNSCFEAYDHEMTMDRINSCFINRSPSYLFRSEDSFKYCQWYLSHLGLDEQNNYYIFSGDNQLILQNLGYGIAIIENSKHLPIAHYEYVVPVSVVGNVSISTSFIDYENIYKN